MARIAAALLLVTATLAYAQSSHPPGSPVNVELYQDHIKLISPVEVIRAEDHPLADSQGLTPIQRAMQLRNRIFDNMVSIQLDVIVNENGRVESAKPTDGPSRFYSQAQAIELRKDFEPIRKDGTIVRAHFTDYVSVLPPELWRPQQTPFPSNPDLKSATITLERTGCLGSCPAYKLTINGNGDVLFTSSDTFVAIPGTHHWHITPQAVTDLLSDFHKGRFLDSLDKYECSWTDRSH